MYRLMQGNYWTGPSKQIATGGAGEVVAKLLRDRLYKILPMYIEYAGQEIWHSKQPIPTARELVAGACSVNGVE